MENIFNDFWNMGDHDKQNAIYSDKSVQIHPTENIHTVMFQEKNELQLLCMAFFW